jgi:hypothetical protein
MSAGIGIMWRPEVRESLRALQLNCPGIITILLGAAVFPSLYFSGLPMRFDWSAYSSLCFAIGLESLILFAVLSIALYPRAVLQALGSHDTQPAVGSQFRRIAVRSWDVLAPTGYFICGLILVIAYNDIIARFRFDGTYDAALNRIDSWLLFGSTVSSLAHRAIVHAPQWLLYLGEGIYVGLEPILGCAILFLALSSRPRQAFEFVGATLTAYYLALVVFFSVPATGPYYLCTSHASLIPTHLAVYSAETAINLKITTLSHISIIQQDYLIALPSLHMAQPLIALWFLRGRRVLAVLLAVYAAILAPTILLFEVHYLVDLIGGAAVAVLALAICDGEFRAGRWSKA